MSLKNSVHNGIASAFKLGSPLIRTGTYTQPGGLNPTTGQTNVQTAVSCSALVVPVHSRSFLGFTNLAAGTEMMIIRASEMLSIAAPGYGDFFVDATDNVRRDVKAARLDLFSEFWTFQCERSGASLTSVATDDWGNLSAYDSNEDWGDLTAATTQEDRGFLT